MTRYMHAGLLCMARYLHAGLLEITGRQFYHLHGQDSEPRPPGIQEYPSTIYDSKSGAKSNAIVGTYWSNLNRLSRLVPCGKGAYALQ